MPLGVDNGGADHNALRFDQNLTARSAIAFEFGNPGLFNDNARKFRRRDIGGLDRSELGVVIDEAIGLRAGDL